MELCTYFKPYTTSRHEIVKSHLIRALDSSPSLTVLAEPPIPNSSLRTDFRVTSEAGSSEFDLTIIALSSIHARTVSTITRSKLSLADPIPPPASLASTSLPAFALTLGGAMEESAAETLRGWREELGPSYSFLIRRISIALLRKRAMMWRF
jgi:hypothetical protein